MIDGSALNRLRHSESDSTATRCCPGMRVAGLDRAAERRAAPSALNRLSETRARR